MIVVDTSVWISVLRYPESDHAATLSTLLDADEVALPAPVRSELLMGTSGQSRTRLAGGPVCATRAVSTEGDVAQARRLGGTRPTTGGLIRPRRPADWRPRGGTRGARLVARRRLHAPRRAEVGAALPLTAQPVRGRAPSWQPRRSVSRPRRQAARLHRGAGLYIARERHRRRRRVRAGHDCASRGWRRCGGAGRAPSRAPVARASRPSRAMASACATIAKFFAKFSPWNLGLWRR